MSLVAASTQTSPIIIQARKRPAPLNPVKKGTSKPVILSSSVAKHQTSDHGYARPSPEANLPPPSSGLTMPMTGFCRTSDSGDRTKRVGKFMIGPKVGSSPVKSLQDYIVRKEGSDQFYIARIFTRKNTVEAKTRDEIQGQNLLFAERFVLTKLVGMEGISHCHEIFGGICQDTVVDENGVESKENVYRLFSVVDCYMPHDYSPMYTSLTSLQSYVINNRRIPESEAIRLFYKTAVIVEKLHQRNVVHRDIKLGNIVLNKGTGEVRLVNFCLSKYLFSEKDLITDQRGSPAYIAPDVISGKPFLGKPADMWSMGIVLYTMLYGEFPFYDQHPSELFRKIKTGLFKLPPNINVKDNTIELITELLRLDPNTRPTASQAKEKVKRIIATEESLMMDSEDQVVPDIDFCVEKSVKQPKVCLLSSPVDLLVGQISEIYFEEIR